MYIFLDEFGDLGFDFSKAKTSRHFVINLLVCQDKRAQEGFIRAVSRTLKNKLNHRMNHSRKIAELKGTGRSALNGRASWKYRDEAGEWVALSHLIG